MLFCVVCHVKLTGRKTRYCGETCRKRAQRHPDLYAPSPKAAKEAREQEARDRETMPAVSPAVEAGEPARIYGALSMRLAREIDACDDQKTVATLSARLVEAVSKLESQQQLVSNEALDELMSRRKRRTAKEA